MGLFDFFNQGANKPQMNIPEILALSQTIHQCSDLTTLRRLFALKGNYDHPQICYDFGVAFIIRGDNDNAKKALIRGVGYGLKAPCLYYDHPFIDSVGQCFMLLLTQFKIRNSTKVYEATALGYVYLSRCIQQTGNEAHDSFKSRALLIKDHEHIIIWQRILLDNVGSGILIEPYMISDFYLASQATDSPHGNLLYQARSIHNNLDDITIAGKDADNYSLQEMAALGKARHNQLFSALEIKYKKGNFNLSTNDIINLFG
jgi:hypothetical protein